MELLDAILCSPPWADVANHNPNFLTPHQQAANGRSEDAPSVVGKFYGSTEGQIGALKEGQPMTSQETREVPVIEWRGAYAESWRDFITPASFAHPAKMSRALLSRILLYGFKEGFWRVGDTLADCFGGVGTTGLVGAYMGLRCVSVELEERFCSLARDNIELHRYRLEKLGCPLPVMVQGDSRRFSEIVGQCGAILTSPPWAEVVGGHQEYDAKYGRFADRKTHGGNLGQSIGTNYGHTPGQIGSLPAGGLDGVVTSPPYAESNIAALDPASASGGQGNAYRRTGKSPRAREAMRNEDYAGSPGNLGSLPAGTLGVDGIVTSPPWEESLDRGRVTKEERIRYARENGISNAEHVSPIDIEHARQEDYGSSEGQIGQQQGETYWGAVKSVYEQCWLALRPSGTLVVVVKGYIRDKQLVDLPGQTATLLTSLGFSVFLRVHALLTETTTEKGLFGEELVQKREKKSFFRRLAEKKGSPPIDYEVCLFARKVGGEAGVLAGLVTSPPYAGLGEVLGTSHSIKGTRANGQPMGLGQSEGHNYGNHPGNLGNLPPGVPPRDGGEHE